MDPISSTTATATAHAAHAHAHAPGCAAALGVVKGMDQLSTSAEPVTSQEWGASADGLWALEADSTSALGLMPILPSPRLHATTAAAAGQGGQQGQQGQGPLTLGRLDLAAASQQQQQKQEAAVRAQASLQQQQAEAQALLRQLGMVTASASAASASSSSPTPAPSQQKKQQQQQQQPHAAAPGSSASSVCSTSGGQQLGAVGPDGKRRGSDTARKDRSNILKAYLMNVGCTKVGQGRDWELFWGGSIDGNKPAHAKMTLMTLTIPVKQNTTPPQIRGARKRRKNPEDGAYEGGKVDWDRCDAKRFSSIIS